MAGQSDPRWVSDVAVDSDSDTSSPDDGVDGKKEDGNPRYGWAADIAAASTNDKREQPWKQLMAGKGEVGKSENRIPEMISKNHLRSLSGGRVGG